MPSLRCHVRCSGRWGGGHGLRKGQWVVPSSSSLRRSGASFPSFGTSSGRPCCAQPSPLLCFSCGPALLAAVCAFRFPSGFHQLLWVQMRFYPHPLTLPHPVSAEKQCGDGGRRETWGLATPQDPGQSCPKNPSLGRGGLGGLSHPPDRRLVKADFVFQPHHTSQGATCAHPDVSKLLGGAGAGAVPQLNPPGSQP